MRSGLIQYFARQINEIAADNVLRAYGAILAFSHILTLAWWQRTEIRTVLASGREHLCWPIFEGCHDYFYPDLAQVQIIFLIYAVISTVALLFFVLRRKWVGAGYWLLILLTVLKFSLMVLDFRTRMNQHYMIFFVTVAFLFVPNKRAAICLILPLFYFWAGTLKLNHEWLSGAALYGNIWFFNHETLPLACAYVVVLELLFVWGLFSKSKYIFFAAFFQFVLFHIISFSVVSFFYPILMISLLAIFPMCYFWPKPQSNSWSWTNRYGLMWGAVFSILQIVSHLFPGDTTLTGEGRLFALHMFDAKLECQSTAVIHRRNKPPENKVLNMPLVPRIRCDPIVFLSRSKTLCNDLSVEQDFVELDLHLATKRTTDMNFTQIVNIENFCHRHLNYSLFWSNDWIIK